MIAIEIPKNEQVEKHWRVRFVEEKESLEGLWMAQMK